MSAGKVGAKGKGKVKEKGKARERDMVIIVLGANPPQVDVAGRPPLPLRSPEGARVAIGQPLPAVIRP